MEQRRVFVVLACVAVLAACDDDAAEPKSDAGGLPDASDVDGGGGADITFTKRVLTDQFFAEGAALGEFDHDYIADVVSGPFVYRGPDFSEAHRYTLGDTFDPHGYSDNFFAFVHDFNNDGWADVLRVAFPGDHATWYENPQGSAGMWMAHRVFEEVDNESPTFEDLTGDGKPELICNHLGNLGYATPNWNDTTQPWTFVSIATGTWSKFTHGLGIGDVNGDGQKDVLLASGVWEQPLIATDPWIAHNAELATAGTGGAQMFVDDVDGDGDSDVITTLEAHGHGVAWFEQTTAYSFVRHVISGWPDDLGPAGVALHEPHALTMADMDGDGDRDIVTGERFWAHVPAGTPDFNAPALLMWFERTTNATFIPHVIDNASGVGTQVMTGDINNDSREDIIVASKKGAFVFVQNP